MIVALVNAVLIFLMVRMNPILTLGVVWGVLNPWFARVESSIQPYIMKAFREDANLECYKPH